MKKVNSNKPFNNRCNLRAGAGPIYNKFCPTPNNPNGSKTKGGDYKGVKLPCSQLYDNLVNYVWEIDLSNGEHLSYVECDYVD